MPLKTKKSIGGKTSKSKTKSSGSDGIVTGLGLDELKQSLDNSGGGGNVDPEMVYLRDQDQVHVVFPLPLEKWATFKQHYVNKATGYRVCTGDGCRYCDDGIFGSLRTMTLVYVLRHYQAANGNFKAKATKNVGYRYIVFSKDTAETLLTRARRRKGRLDDVVYIIERQGADTQTKYDVEGTATRPDPKILKGWKSGNFDVVEKVKAIRAAEQKKKVVADDDEDDDDYDFEEDYDIDEDRPKKKKKSSSASGRRRK